MSEQNINLKYSQFVAQQTERLNKKVLYLKLTEQIPKDFRNQLEKQGFKNQEDNEQLFSFDLDETIQLKQHFNNILALYKLFSSFKPPICCLLSNQPQADYRLQQAQQTFELTQLFNLLKPGEFLCQAHLFPNHSSELVASFREVYRLDFSAQTQLIHSSFVILKPQDTFGQPVLLPHQHTLTRMAIGRDSESAFVLEVAKKVLHKETLHKTIIEISAAAGMGKSTFLKSLVPQIKDMGVACLFLSCMDFINAPLEAPLAKFIQELFSKSFQILGLDPSASALSTWLDHIDTYLFYEYLGLPLSSEEQSVLGHYSPEVLRSLRSQKLVLWLAELSDLQPFCLVIEDGHWADLDTLSFLNEFAQYTPIHQSVFVLVTSRPNQSLVQQLPDLIDKIDVLKLNALSLADSKLLADSLTLAQRLPWQVDSDVFVSSEWIQHCILKAEGHPLLLTQLLGQGPKVNQPLEIDTDLNSLFLTAYSNLSHSCQSFLDFASCLGRTFNPLRIPLGNDEQRQHWLAEAQQAQLVFQDGTQWYLVHALLRDTLYHKLDKSERHRLHLALAHEFLDEPNLYAEHLALAQDPRAQEAFLKAAQQLQEQYQLHAALSLLERALSYIKVPAQRIEILCQQGWLFEQFGDGKSCLKRFDEAKSHAVHSDLKNDLEINLGRLAALRLLGSLQQGAEIVELIQQQLHEHQEALTQFRARFAYFKGCVAFSQGDLEHCAKAHQEAIKLIESLGEIKEKQLMLVYAQAWSGMGDAYYAQGLFKEAAQAMTRAIQLAKDHRFGRIVVSTAHMLAIVLTYLGRAQEGLKEAEQCHRLALTVNDTRASLFAELNMALPLLWAGQARLAPSYCESALKRVEWMGSSVLTGMSKAFISHVLWRSGERKRAIEFAQFAHQLAMQGGSKLYGGVALGALLLNLDLPKKQGIEYIDQGLKLFQTQVISHNYLYFTLGALPYLIRFKDKERLAKLNEILHEFFKQDLKSISSQTKPILDCVSMLLTSCSTLSYALENSASDSDLLQSISSFAQEAERWSQHGIKLFEQMTLELISNFERAMNEQFH